MNNTELEIKDSPVDIIKFAIQNNSNLDGIEKLLVLKERWDSLESKKSYNKAMAAFKKNPPEINKDKTVKYKDVKYSHASLYNVTEKINSELSKHGLSASWKISQTDKIVVTCKITHVDGHSEETSLQACSDTSGSKNSIQAIGSTVTYLQRYTLLALTGLATYDQDDDAQSTSKLSQEQVLSLSELIKKKNADIKRFLDFFKIETIENLNANDYLKAISMLNSKGYVKEPKEKPIEKEVN